MSTKTLWCKKCGKVAQDLAHVVDALTACPACGGRDLEAKDDDSPFPLDRAAPPVPLRLVPDDQEDLRALYLALELRVMALEQAHDALERQVQASQDPPADAEVIENPGLTDGEQDPPKAA